MNDVEKYEFDRQGFLVVEKMLTPEETSSLHDAVDRTEAHAAAHVDLPPRKRALWGMEYHANEERGYFTYGAAEPKRTLIVEDFFNFEPGFDCLVDHPRTMDYVREIVMGPIRINNSEIRLRYTGNATESHMGGPIDHKYRYSFTAGRIDAMMIRVIYFIDNVRIEDGAFCVVPGTHKANFASPYANDPHQEPGMIGLPVSAGDAIIFTENLRHGGLVNHSPRTRKTLHVGYGPAWMMSQNPSTMDEPQFVTGTAGHVGLSTQRGHELPGHNRNEGHVMATTSRISKRRLGKTGYEVSEIGFGAWAIGGSWGEDVDETAALSALNAAVDDGVNFIDTADVYGDGRSEVLIGKLLGSRSERIYVATKMGRFAGWAATYEAVETAAVASINRLGVDHLDLVQLHCIPSVMLEGPVFEHLDRLKSKGLIAHYGASVESIAEGQTCLSVPGCATLQVIFNIYRQRLISDLFPAAQTSDVGIIARVPLVSGVLSGKFQSGHKFLEGDHRSFNANGEMFNVGETFAGVPFEDAVRIAGKVSAIVGDGHPLAVSALRWILDYPAVSTVIPGAKSAEQAHANSAASAVAPLSAQTHAALAALYQHEIDALVRGPY